jgi:hypothetical protein
VSGERRRVMRGFLLIVALVLFVPSFALAGAQAGVGGVTTSVIPDPGYCWAGGVVPGPPPGVYLPTSTQPDGSGVGVALGPGEGPGSAAVSGAQKAAKTGPGQAVTSAHRVRSQAYVPPGVWRWLAEHPVRAR